MRSPISAGVRRFRDFRDSIKRRASNRAREKQWNLMALAGRCGIEATVPQKKMLALPVTDLPQK
jgi:hypothetical protein